MSDALNDTPQSDQIFDDFLKAIGAHEKGEIYFSDLVNALYSAKCQTKVIERQLAAERAKVEQLRWAILSVIPDGPYDPVMEPQWLYCAEALAATESVEGSRAP